MSKYMVIGSYSEPRIGRVVDQIFADSMHAQGVETIPISETESATDSVVYQLGRLKPIAMQPGEITTTTIFIPAGNHRLHWRAILVPQDDDQHMINVRMVGCTTYTHALGVVVSSENIIRTDLDDGEAIGGCVDVSVNLSGTYAFTLYGYGQQVLLEAFILSLE